MKSPKFDYAVLVLGMHRSGTSALAGVLARCGLGVPQQLLGPSEANERGFFESAAINELNNRVLADFGQPWHSLEPIADDSWQGEAIARCRDEISALVSEQFSTSRSPVIKDPRICRLLPLWTPALAAVSKDVRISAIIRSPVEVARSLAHRNQIEIEAGLLLWARYNLDAERHSRGMFRRFVSYEELLHDWRVALGKLDLPTEPAAIDEASIEEFLSQSLRHHHEGEAEPAKVQLAAQAYEILSRWAREGESFDDHPSLDALCSKLDDMGPVLNELSEKGRLERKRRAHLASQSAASEAQLDSKERQLANVTEAVERSLREIEKKSDAFNQLAQQMGLEFARATRSAEEKDRAFRALAEERLQAAHALVAEKDDAIRRLAAEHESDVGELNTARDELANRLGEAEQLLEASRARWQAMDEELSAAHAAADVTDAELQRVKRKYRSTQVILQRERSRTQRLEAEVGRAEERIRELEHRFAIRLGSALHGLFANASKVLPLRSAKSSRKQLERRLVRESGFFDADWYVAAYPDVASARVDPVAHFADLGWREGRNPGPAFCTTRYLRRYRDVAELDINPLIHFVEHGRFEGREVHGVGELPSRTDDERPPVAVALPPAIPVFAGRPEFRAPIAWQRACQLADVDHAVIVEGLGLVVISDLASRQAFEQLLADFETLSGKSGKLAAEPGGVAGLPAMEDGWFATSHRLNVRWDVTEPTVIRALQVDPVNGRLTLVGEGLATGKLDPIALELASPVLPLMFMAASCDGALVGAGITAFPSLFRGGAHYSEFVAFGEGCDFNVMEFSKNLERQLRLVRAGDADPVVRAIEVEITSVDGHGPLFGRACRDLLERVLMVDVATSMARGDGPRRHHLTEAVQLSASSPSRRSGGKLTLAADMLPALSILVAHSKSRRTKRTVTMGLIVNESDPSQPAVWFDPPEIKVSIAGVQSRHYPLPFPRLSGAAAKIDLAAIRQIGRPLDDAELLVPDAAVVADSLPPGVSIDWLVDPMDWDEMLLGQSIEALGLQQSLGRQRLLFVRHPSPLVQDVVRSALGSEPAIFADADSALAEATATYIGRLGGGLILHDPRTAAILASLLIDSAVSTASCAVVSTVRQGKSWRTQMVDSGVLPTDRQLVLGPGASSPAEMIWRATYPVTEPSRLWLARPDDVRRWHGGDRSGKEIHLLTSIVSASLEGESRSDSVEFSVAPATLQRSINAKVLVG